MMIVLLVILAALLAVLVWHRVWSNGAMRCSCGHPVRGHDAIGCDALYPSGYGCRCPLTRDAALANARALAGGDA